MVFLKALTHPQTQTNDHTVASHLTRLQKNCIETHCEDYCQLHSSVYVLHLCEMQALVSWH